MPGQHRAGPIRPRRARGAPLILAPIFALAALVTASTVDDSAAPGRNTTTGVGGTAAPAQALPVTGPAPVATPTPPAPVAEPLPAPQIGGEGLAGAVPAPPPPAAPTSATTASAHRVDRYEQQVIDLTNAERTSRGCRPLVADPALTAAAQEHAENMARRGFFDHVDPSGTGPSDRVEDAGYNWQAVAENIAAGPRTPADVVAGWMNSPGHRANILDCDLDEIGVAYVNATGSPYGRYWVQDFATPAP